MRIILVLGVFVLGLGLAFALLSGAQTVRAAPQNYFVEPGGTGTACSQFTPCSLPTALTLAANGDTIYAARGTYTGKGTAVVSLGISIQLLGGWNGAIFGPIAREPERYVSILDGEFERRVIEINGNATPTIDGFTITRGNATQNITNCDENKPDGCGGGIFIYQAHPIISSNVITNNIAAITTAGYPTGTTGYGGGIYISSAPGTIISGNLIISNTGSLVNCGEGGGIHIYRYEDVSGAMVQYNQILSNTATTTNLGCAWGGGISGGPDDVMIKGNLISGNRANGYGGGQGAGIYQWYGSATYYYNQITQNQGNVTGEAVYLGYSRSRFENNQVVDNATYGGLQLVNGTADGPTLINNLFARNGSQEIEFVGYSSAPLPAKMIHNTLIGSAGGFGVYVDSGYVTLSMTDTIVTNFSWGITNTIPASSTLMIDHTLFWANDQDGLRGANAVDGDPSFAIDGYHLTFGSAAIDAGVDAGVDADIEGDWRPFGLGVDIGADEAEYPYLFLPLILRN